MTTAIVGINWGDEGKGRMVDLLCEDYDVVVRYQGGNNAGHTVVNEKGKFILNLLPSGILRSSTINVMGPGMVIDLEHLCGEIDKLRKGGIDIAPENLRISDKAVICMPYHKLLDCLEEDRLGDKKFGSTRRGIAPAYSDKYMKKALRMGDLLHPEYIKDRLNDILEWKNLIINGCYGSDKIEPEDMLKWLETYGAPLKQYICDTSYELDTAISSGKKIMFEAQLGALRDIDYGIYPFTTSSSAIAAYAPIGAGVPWARLDETIGIMKAYSSCVGEGPFTCELFGDEAGALREAGAEYGAATGRPRRVGGFDVVASKYGCMVQGATHLALTKLDVLSYLRKIPVCTAYSVDGQIIHEFPTGITLEKATPVYEYMDGWMCDISSCKTEKELPAAALSYIKYIESAVGCPIKYVSVGASREQYIQLF